MNRVAVHVRCNTAGVVKREKREGRETIMVPSFAAKADTVLNEILYPREELMSSMAGLNRTPAPLGHPTINGKFVEAKDPEALARNHIFAWNENARWDGDRIALDVVIDEARAKESEGGRAVLNAIEKQKPISTSTGLYCNLEEVEADGHKAIARDIKWDHVAILLNEKPAISTDDGVGIFVNAKGEDEKIEVINSAIDYAEDELDWAGTRLFDALDRLEKAGRWERVKAALMGLLAPEREKPPEQGAREMADEKQLDALSAKVNAIEESLKGIGDQIANAISGAVKPLIDKVNAEEAKTKADEDEEKAKLEEKVTKANVLTAEAAKATPINTLRELAKIAEPGKAAAINGAATNGIAEVYDLNEVMGLTKKEAV